MNFYLKKLSLSTLFAAILLFTSCIAEEAEDIDGLMDPVVVEEGILGTWIYNPTDEDNVASHIWIIEPRQSRIFKICDYGAGDVNAGVVVKSRISFNVLTLEESDIHTPTGTTCTVSVEANAKYSLNLVSENVLQISRQGVTIQYSRKTSIEE